MSSEIMKNVQNILGTVADGAKDAAGEINKAVQTQNEKIEKEVRDSGKKNKKKKFFQNKEVPKGKYIDLWTDYSCEAHRKRYYTKEISNVSEKKFMEVVNEFMKRNYVPAVVVPRLICWDNIRDLTSGYIIEINAESTIANPFVGMALFRKVGKFSFVDLKIFMAPPDLPDELLNPIPIDSNLQMSAIGFFLGILIVMMSVLLLFVLPSFGIVLLLFGLFTTGVCFFGFKKLQAIIEHNKKCGEQRKKWDEAWDEWDRTKYVNIKQEVVNGHLSRIYSAVLESFYKVADIALKDAEVKVEEDEKLKMSEINQLINQRREEVK